MGEGGTVAVVLGRPLSVARAAEQLGCSKEQVRWLCRKRHLHGIRLGARTWRISRAELERFVAAGGIEGVG